MKKWLIHKLLKGFANQEISQIFWPYMINHVHSNEPIKYSQKHQRRMIREAAKQADQMHRSLHA